MALGKKARQEKTDFENEGQELGKYAYPKINPTLDRIGDLTMNPDEYRQNLLNTYYNSDNSAMWSDAMRNYRRQMANATANNYAATNGGYSSAGDKYYNDIQRYQNDLNSRLWDYGVNSANSMYNKDLANTQDYYNTLTNQWGLKKAGDAIDAYNQQVDKSNKQWWTNALNEVGSAVEALAPGPWKAIGTGMRVGGWAGSTDYSDNLARLAGQFGGNVDPSAYRNGATDLGGIVSSGINNWMNWGGVKNPLGGSESLGSNSQGYSAGYTPFTLDSLKKLKGNPNG